MYRVTVFDQSEDISTLALDDVEVNATGLRMLLTRVLGLDEDGVAAFIYTLETRGVCEWFNVDPNNPYHFAARKVG